MRRILTGLLAIGVVSVGAVVGIQAQRQRRRASYPKPESLILHTEMENDSFNGYQRVLKLEGAVNLRDIGGYQTTDGQRVKWGMVYRSGGLAQLTDSDLAFLQSRDVKVICDLRAHEEVAAAPDRLPHGSTYYHLPLRTEGSTNQRSRRRMWALLFNPEQLGEFMLETYTKTMIDDNANVFGEVLRKLVDSENLPALFHCTAGKDRTGMTAALLLLLLGVPEATVIADYTLSNRDYAKYQRVTEKMIEPVKWLGIHNDDLYPMLVSNAYTMQFSLNYLREQYGSVTNYLHTRAGVDDATIAQLKHLLLE